MIFNTKEIEKPESLYDMIKRRNRAIELVHLIKNAQDELHKVAGSTSWINRNCVSSDGIYRLDKCEKEIDSVFWRLAINACKITDLMTDKNKWKYLEKIEKDTPHFCELEIEALEQNLYSIYGQNFTTTVQEVYKTLINCHYCGGTWQNRKRSNLQKIEPIFKIAGNINWEERYWNCFRYRENNYGGFNYDDLLMVCYLLDGRGRPNYAEKFCALANTALEQKKQNWVDTDYFEVTCFKNGNQTVKWNEEKLYILEDFNKYGAGLSNELPDVLKKKYKKEHFQS